MMEFILACVFLAGIAIFLICLVWLLITIIKHKSKKIPIIFIIASVIAIIPSYIYFSLDSGTDPTSSSTSSSGQSNDSVHSFNKSAILSNSENGQKIRMTVQSVQQVDPDDLLVTDISHNYKQTHQYVVVTYKVTALSSKVDLDTFDGSNLSVYDGKGQSSITSSNRDSVTPNKLHKGETQVMEIGEGLRNKSSQVTVHFSNETWKGAITNDQQ